MFGSYTYLTIAILSCCHFGSTYILLMSRITTKWKSFHQSQMCHSRYIRTFCSITLKLNPKIILLTWWTNFTLFSVWIVWISKNNNISVYNSLLSMCFMCVKHTLKNLETVGCWISNGKQNSQFNAVNYGNVSSYSPDVIQPTKSPTAYIRMIFSYIFLYKISYEIQNLLNISLPFEFSDECKLFEKKNKYFKLMVANERNIKCIKLRHWRFGSRLSVLASILRW